MYVKTPWNLVLAGLIAFQLTGCKVGVPVVSELGTLPGFKLDQTVVPVNSKTSPTFSVTGLCSDQFDNVEVSVDGGLAWKKLVDSASTSVVNCATTGVFQASFDLTAQPLELGKWTPSGSYNFLYFRGVSYYGYSEAQKLRLDNSVKPVLNTVVAGGSSLSNGSGYTLSNRIYSFGSGSAVQMNQGYQLEGAVSW